MEILVRVSTGRTLVELQEPPEGPGHRYVFGNDLVLERLDNKTPGNGLPLSEQQRRAGTHSGFLTTLRVGALSDIYFPPGIYLFQYEGTYRFHAVPATPSGPGLPRGQVIARGVLVLDGKNNFQPVELNRFAIVGGTEAYSSARGQVTEPNDDDRLLDIQL